MTSRLQAVVIDAVAPRDLARFWAHALGWETQDHRDGRATLVPHDATGFEIVLRPGAAAKVGQNRIHFDLTTTSLDDQSTTVEELTALGASHVDVGQGADEDHVVLADPEGNELCVLAPGNRFLAGCPRLGAVNCDGLSALDHFYSAALGWPLVWDQDEETAIQAPTGDGPKVTWSGPPLMPRRGPERLHLHLAPQPGEDLDAALEHLLGLGATFGSARLTPPCNQVIPLIDVDGNHICLTA